VDERYVRLLKKSEMDGSNQPEEEDEDEQQAGE
jgi:hypothetical protein